MTKKVKKEEIREFKNIEEKKQALQKFMNETNREYKSTVLKWGSSELPPERISFGIASLDQLTGGGIPHKRFSVIWGSKGTGKSTLAYNLITSAQKKKKLCAYIDLERSFEGERAKKIGVNLEELVLATEFDNAEQALDTLIDMCRKKVIDVIILDSLQALSPKGEQETKTGKEKSLEDDTMALLARKLSQFFRMSASGVYKGDVAIVLIGQARMNLGGFIALESLSGGHALQHWSALTLQLRRGTKSDAPTKQIQTEKGKEKMIIGFDSVIKLEKVKISGTAIEGSKIHIPFLFKTGF